MGETEREKRGGEERSQGAHRGSPATGEGDLHLGSSLPLLPFSFSSPSSSLPSPLLLLLFSLLLLSLLPFPLFAYLTLTLTFSALLPQPPQGWNDRNVIVPGSRELLFPVSSRSRHPLFLVYTDSLHSLCLYKSPLHFITKLSRL